MDMKTSAERRGFNALIALINNPEACLDLTTARD